MKSSGRKPRSCKSPRFAGSRPRQSCCLKRPTQPRQTKRTTKFSLATHRLTVGRRGGMGGFSSATAHHVWRISYACRKLNAFAGLLCASPRLGRWRERIFRCPRHLRVQLRKLHRLKRAYHYQKPYQNSEYQLLIHFNTPFVFSLLDFSFFKKKKNHSATTAFLLTLVHFNNLQPCPGHLQALRLNLHCPNLLRQNRLQP